MKARTEKPHALVGAFPKHHGEVMAKKTKAASTTEGQVAEKPEVVISYKGFDKQMQCRGYQFEIGKTYLHDGSVEACASGFHACEYPLDVFNYYTPAESQFAIVEQSGKISRHNDDSKVASSSLSVKASIGIPGLITAAFEFITKRCDPANTEHATGYRSASSATGHSSASSATGHRSASSATGDRSASSATGHRSASSATGDRSASLTTGWYSSSEIKPNADGKKLHAVAVATGGESKARAPLGSAIVVCFRGPYGELIHIRASKVGENGIKPDAWYSLDKNGEFVEV